MLHICNTQTQGLWLKIKHYFQLYMLHIPRHPRCKTLTIPSFSHNVIKLCPVSPATVRALLPRDGNHLLADVAAGEQPDERGRRRPDPLGNVLHVDDLPFLQVPRHLLLKPAVLSAVVGRQEALHADALGDELEQVRRPVGPLQVVLRDLPAHGDPAVGAHVE
uniref:Uncharacterized protein n=1 Tax=Arundo donax TaxID=35708 RepID=A0A0A9G9A9_ARUDO